ncbi:cysteine-rich protein 2-binding protein [Danaus plexippus]|uniref:cysteine-rich protein 2-binding protein n=1 Tax=Danaus plexippus TaxID=13037 RepID=UPI002AB21E70|nr:cysteine-rich protein 2-binding protein [Danaus plexippus]
MNETSTIIATTSTIDTDAGNTETLTPIVCKYCQQPENKQYKPCLVCEKCKCAVHLICLRRPGTPGDIDGDVFFDFTCLECSPTKEELFERNKFPWVHVLLLTLNHLSEHMQGISNSGYFHYKTHICSFVDRNWTLLFGTRNRKKNWIGTISGALSVYSNTFFRSGSVALGESGWWKLMHGFSPAVAAHILQEMNKEKTKGQPRNQFTLDSVLFISKIKLMGYGVYLNVEMNPNKRRKLDSDASESSEVKTYEGEERHEYLEEPESLTCVTAKDNSDSFWEFDFAPASRVQSRVSSSRPSVYYDSDTNSHSDGDKSQQTKKTSKTKKIVEDKEIFRKESLFSTLPNSIDMPWVEKHSSESDKRKLVPLTEYEEVQLLKTVENLIPRVKDPSKKAELYRLKAKLSLRRLKRHQHKPVFDLDKAVKVLGGYVTEDHTVAMNAECILDRFQRSYLIDNLCGTIASTNYGTMLLSHIEPTTFRSPYSGAILKPFIRRDATSRPLWLKVTEELLMKTHRHVPEYRVPPRPVLSYSYVRPQHIAAVNSLCAQFFWPGIDLTEALQYPEFSCVVTFGRLVVACAFLVPDVRQSEAYISFILTRPEWRNAGIATFMMYHLLQTCTDKDVTLHVSPTNPAVFLYQKFGFKVEELIQDFYEKYYDIDHKGCRHALFLRLVR